MSIMENKNFFDPYACINSNFNQNPIQNNNPMTMQNNQTPDIMVPIITPREYYEQQYMYYRCLNEMMDFSIKKRQIEGTDNTKK